jgi:hypothetical protein
LDNLLLPIAMDFDIPTHKSNKKLDDLNKIYRIHFNCLFKKKKTHWIRRENRVIDQGRFMIYYYPFCSKHLSFECIVLVKGAHQVHSCNNYHTFSMKRTLQIKQKSKKNQIESNDVIDSSCIFGINGVNHQIYASSQSTITDQ